MLSREKKEDICVYGKSLIDGEFESYAGRYKYNASNEYWQHIYDLSIVLTKDFITSTKIESNTSRYVLCTESKSTSDATQCGNWSYVYHHTTTPSIKYDANIGVEYCKKLENDTNCTFTSNQIDQICINHLTHQPSSINRRYVTSACVNGFPQFTNLNTLNRSSIKRQT